MANVFRVFRLNRNSDINFVCERVKIQVYNSVENTTSKQQPNTKRSNSMGILSRWKRAVPSIRHCSMVKFHCIAMVSSTSRNLIRIKFPLLPSLISIKWILIAINFIFIDSLSLSSVCCSLCVLR